MTSDCKGSIYDKLLNPGETVNANITVGPYAGACPSTWVISANYFALLHFAAKEECYPNSFAET